MKRRMHRRQRRFLAGVVGTQTMPLTWIFSIYPFGLKLGHHPISNILPDALPTPVTTADVHALYERSRTSRTLHLSFLDLRYRFGLYLFGLYHSWTFIGLYYGPLTPSDASTTHTANGTSVHIFCIYAVIVYRSQLLTYSRTLSGPLSWTSRSALDAPYLPTYLALPRYSLAVLLSDALAFTY